MMRPEILMLAKQKIGEHLKMIREGKGISTYRITKDHNIPFRLIKAIEEGKTNYTIDTFLAYLNAIDCYFYLANKDGKQNDLDDLIDKATDPSKQT